MINANVNLKAILCHATFDQGSSSEPYMWPSFFYLDISTISRPSGSRLVTHTPQTNWTTRGAFPDGIQAGDLVSIPPVLGNYDVSLDPGGLDIAIIGAIFVLLEEDRTPGDAIRAGHQAYADTVDEVLNSYVDSVFPDANSSPTPAQVRLMANQIQSQVRSAIRNKMSWYQLIRAQDDFIGFGYRILDGDQVRQVSARPYGRQSFTTRITSSHQNLGRTYVYDYEVFGSTTVVDDSQPPSGANEQLELYLQAVNEVKSIDDRVDNLEHQLQKTPSERRELIDELMHLRREALPQMLVQLADARATLERNQIRSAESRGSFTAATTDRGAQLNVTHGHLFVESATVASPKLADDDEGEPS